MTTPSSQDEHCQKCYMMLPVDELGRVPQHRKCVGYGVDGNGAHSWIANEMCVKSRHPSREELKRRKERRKQAAADLIGTPDIAVALDSYIEGRNEYAEHVPAWRRAALSAYNKKYERTFARAYEYATKCAVYNRRAETLGDVYCRFCGERLFAQIKHPHETVAKSHDAQRHLTLCALQLLAGMREPTKPGYRALPLEAEWRDDPPRATPASSGPLFGGHP